MYGKEMILDMYDCDVGMFNRKSIKMFWRMLCETIDMEAADNHFWDWVGDEDAEKEAPDHLTGTSGIQFITTSNITIHTIKNLKEVYLNIFSCKDFDCDKTFQFCKNFFRADMTDRQVISRGLNSRYNMEPIL